MKVHFHKYHGTGNDFIIIDNRNGAIAELHTDTIKSWCERRFGIGADGLMLLNLKADYDFEMKYFNADGRESSMCGNGGRCMVKFAYSLGLHRSRYHFMAVDGEHQAEIDDNGTVRLKMHDVKEVMEIYGDYMLNTGSPHYVKLVHGVMGCDVVKKGRDIRNSADFVKEGINVNFVEQTDPDEIIVRTYERGVEDETLSCGTGVTASALVLFHNDVGFNDVTVTTKGGKLSVEYDRMADGSYENIWLCGPAEKVFEGDAETDH